MVFIPFPDWKPDMGALNSGALVVATGVLPLAAGYGPWKSFVPYMQALNSQPLGGTISRQDSGQRDVWAGTATQLWRLSRLTLGWDNVSQGVGGEVVLDGVDTVTYEGAATTYGETAGTGPYSCPPNERWNFVQFGHHLLAHNINDPVQVIDIETGAAFIDLAGSPPRGRYGTVVKDFMVLGNLDDPHMIHWSGANNIEQWIIGENQSDIQVFASTDGPITGLIGGETGFVFQEEAVSRMTYVGPPLVFEIAKIAEKRGCKAPWSIVRAANTVFYLSPEGFAALSAQGESKLIDLGAWSEFFTADAATSFIHQTRGVVDPWRSRVFWLYRSVNCHHLYDTILCWDYGVNKATICRIELSEAIQAATAGLTLDTMDHLGPIDALAVSFDDDSLKGEVPQFAAFNAAYRLGFFSGPNQEAVLETSDIEFARSKRVFVSGLRPQVDAPISYMRLGTKALPNAAKVYTPETTPEGSTGICPFRTDTRYASVRLRIPAQELADQGWTRAIGFEPFIRPSGHR